MWQSNTSDSSNYQYYSGDVSSYGPNNQHSQMNQNEGYQPLHHAGGWGQPAYNGSIAAPAMHNSSIGNSSYPFGSSESYGHYNGHCENGNSVSNQGSNHVLNGQGPWHQDQSSTKALPSPVFQNEQSYPVPNTWSNQAGGTNNLYCGSSFTNNAYPNHAQGLMAPMERHHPVQFPHSSHRPNISGPPGRGRGRGRGCFPQNLRGGQVAMGPGRGGNHMAADRGRGRKKNPRPAKSTGKSNETWNSHTHVCDPCERWFSNEEQLAKHISEHRTCGIDGCKLTAHSGVIDKHIKMQHDTGLFQKMKDMVNSDDFAKWRAERKLRYPSRENIVKRQEEQEEKAKRGESIGNENGRFSRNRGAPNKRNQRREKSRNFKAGINQTPAKVEPQKNVVPNKLSDTNKEDKRSKPFMAHKGKKPFAHSIDEEQIQDNLANEDKAFSDTEWEPLPETESDKVAVVPKLSAALNTLASMYESDSDLDSETGSSKPTEIKNATPEIKIEPINEEGDSPMELPICREEIDKRDIGKEEKEDGENQRKISNKRSNQPRDHAEGKPKHRKMNHHDKNTNGFKRKPDVSLLQKLLANEIRHERNVVLQCIRYIVENNFFAVAPLEKTPKLECEPETTLSDDKANLSVPFDATNLSGNGFIGESQNMESTQLTCSSEMAVCDNKMNEPSTVLT